MVKQERAARSRNSLVQAAADQFDRDGYAGASLSRICKTAGISSGGLTFHFSSKEDLARAVEELGHEVVLATVERFRAKSEPPLHRLVGLTLELMRQAEEEPSVRALIRLERERPGAPQWAALWYPEAVELVQQAADAGQLRPNARPESVAALAVHLVTGAEILARRQRDAGEAAQPPESSTALLERIWKLVLAGIVTPTGNGTGNHPTTPRPTPAPLAFQTPASSPTRAAAAPPEQLRPRRSNAASPAFEARGQEAEPQPSPAGA